MLRYQAALLLLRITAVLPPMRALAKHIKRLLPLLLPQLLLLLGPLASLLSTEALQGDRL